MAVSDSIDNTSALVSVPLVSVVVTTHNRSSLLMEALESVFRQSHEDLECIVVDDASTDDTAEQLAGIRDPRLRVIRHAENRHLSASRNTGIREAKGKYICFLDDDDTWHPEKIAKQLEVFSRKPECGLVYCWMAYYNMGVLNCERKPTLAGNILDQVLVDQPLCNGSGFMIPRVVFDQTGLFDESIRRGVDGDIVRRICQHYPVDYVAEILVFYREDSPERITTQSRQNIEAAIHGERIKFEKFRDALEGKPMTRARIWWKIASHYDMLGDVSGSKQARLNAAKALGRGAVLKYRLLSVIPMGIRNRLDWRYRRTKGRVAEVRSHILVRWYAFLDRMKWSKPDDAYEESWYSKRNYGEWNRDVRSFCQIIHALFQPSSVADVGCATGAYLKRFQDIGVGVTLGLEGSPKAIKHAAVDTVRRHDLREPYTPSRTFDLVLCLEVAEHLHECYAATLVDTVASLVSKEAGTLIFSAATPGQKGINHYNLQPHEYWIQRFEKKGFSYDADLSERIRLEYHPAILTWLSENIMVFHRVNPTQRPPSL